MNDKSMLIKQFEGHKPGWKVYAGLTGNVSIEEMDRVYLFNTKIICDDNSLKGQCTYLGQAQDVEVSILKEDKILASKIFKSQKSKKYSYITMDFNDLDLERYSQNSISTYTLKIRHLNEENTIVFSNKSVKTNSGKIKVNDENFHVKGINVHQEDIHKGIALNKCDIEKIYSHINKLNCNFVRLVHYLIAKKFTTI